MKNKYKIAEFKKNQMVIFYRYKNKLLCWSVICSPKEYGVLEDVFDMARFSLEDKVHNFITKE